MEDMAKWMIMAGIIIVIAGGLLLLLSKFPALSNMPGNFVFTTGNMTCFVPLAASIILSILLTIILNVALQIFRK